MLKDKVVKYPRFGYFHVKSGVDSESIKRLMKKYKNADDLIGKMAYKALIALEQDISNGKNLFERIISELKNENVIGFQEFGGKKIDIDVSSFRPNEDNADHVYFQIANNRNDTLYKKKIGSEREIIGLDDDEYIGEYCNALYYFRNQCLLLQRNKFSVSVSQFSNFFHLCISDYYQKDIPKKDRISFPVFVKLVPDLNQDLLNKIRHNNITFEKIKINGDAAKINRVARANMPIYENIEKLLHGFSGYEFSLEIKVRKEKGKFSGNLSSQHIQDLYKYHTMCNEDDELQIITQMKDEDVRDTLDWSIPKRERVIQVTYFHQHPPGIDEMYQKMRIIFEEDAPNLV